MEAVAGCWVAMIVGGILFSVGGLGTLVCMPIEVARPGAIPEVVIRAFAVLSLSGLAVIALGFAGCMVSCGTM